AVRSIDRGADRAVLRALLRADVADHDLARVDADAHLELRQPEAPLLLVHVDERALHLEGARDGALRVVRRGERRAEEREDAVALELVDGGAVPREDADHALEIAVQGPDDLVGRQKAG